MNHSHFSLFPEAQPSGRSGKESPMKLKKSTIILFVACILGLSLLLYPTISDYWNSKHATQAIVTYVEALEEIDDTDYQAIWESAIEYNKLLLERDNEFSLTPELRERYFKEMNVTEDGLMGYVEISKLGVSLPLYHGTTEDVLQRAIGHIEWSSLPTGGESTHCVVSGHRGLPSAKLLTDLDKLREGDLFTLTILGEVLTYEVDQIRTVEPADASELLIREGKDYCTLVTCTPYGINTHRLLVRGHRIETLTKENVYVVSEAVVIDPLIVAPIVAFPFLFILLMIVLFKRPDGGTNTNIRKKPKNTEK